MVKYRPHRGGLKEAMAEAKTFNTIDEMKEHICNEDLFLSINPEDIVVGDPAGHDLRVGWYDVRIVATKRIRDTAFDPPAAIGFCTIE